MTAESDLRGALMSALQADAALGALVQRVFDGEPVKASAPWVALGEMSSGDWGTKDREGRELRIAFALRDEGGGPDRIGQMLVRVDSIIRTIGGALAGQWETGSVTLIRSRLLRSGETQWRAIADYRVRLLKV